MTQLPANQVQELQELENRLDKLIEQYATIKNENNSLKTKQDALVREKAKLLEKTTLARSRVEAMITRLKAMEHGSWLKKTLPVSITIMGKEYKIACAVEEQDDLIHSAQQLDAQMRKLRDSGKIVGPDRIAVMTALNLAHELQMLKTQNALLNQQLSECLAKLSQKIENVLDNP